jgi:uncharacterized membrane protein
MTGAASAQLLTTHARDAVYDLVLLAHVLSALVGFGAVVVAGGYAMGLLRSGRGSDGVRRYYRPGINWGGRIIWLVPVFGVALIQMSHGDWTFSEGWITAGLMLWVVSALVGEMALWPTERKLQAWVADEEGTDVVPRSQCLQVIGMAAGLFVVLVVATVLMVAKP